MVFSVLNYLYVKNECYRCCLKFFLELITKHKSRDLEISSDNQ